MGKVGFLNLSSNGMAFDPQTGESFQMNESAKHIIKLLQEGKTSEAIAKSLTEAFDITYERALTDVLEFQVQIQSMGLSL